MKTGIYEWLRELAVFYILLTSFLNLVPNGKYEKYIRFFMGLLLLFMLCTPVFAMFGQAEALMETFETNFRREELLRKNEEFEGLREMYLEKGYEAQLRKEILDALSRKGIEAEKVELRRQGEDVRAVIYMEKTPSMEEKGEIADGIREACGLGDGDFEIKASEHGSEAVGRGAASGTSFGCGVPSRFPEGGVPRGGEASGGGDKKPET